MLPNVCHAQLHQNSQNTEQILGSSQTGLIALYYILVILVLQGSLDQSLRGHMSWNISKAAWVQAESVRKAEEARMKQEAKEATLRATKEKLDRLQAAWKEDQHLKEVPMLESYDITAADAVIRLHPILCISTGCDGL